jgi:hypothetical protein
VRTPVGQLQRVSQHSYTHVRACDSMASMVHPLPWDCHVDPGALESGVVDLITGGAVVAGAVGDALVACDHLEQTRRGEAGLGAVTSLWLLDAVMSLPSGVPVRASDLSESTWEYLRVAPDGVVAIDAGWVTRVLSPPLTVVAAVVRGAGWRRPLQLVGQFTPFAQRVVVLDKMPPPRLVWEAQVTGVGVWSIEDGRPVEVCAPEPFKRRYWKPAGWRFAERAYAASLTAKPPFGSSPAFADRPVRTAVARSGPRQLALPLM